MAKNISSRFGVADGFFEDNYEAGSDNAPTPNHSDTETNAEKVFMEEPVTEKAETNEIDFDKLSNEKLLEMIKKAQETENNKPKELGETRGRKGMKLPRINMCFSDKNYEYIKYESCRRGMSNTQFVNMILQKYRESPEGYID